ncbi:MAG TPA: response regulator [Thermohalobaculum sp.]|nr:response regulator [Thermohalobaculum sp.]
MQLAGLKILLAGDDAARRLVAQRMLEGLGARVSAVENGSQALERVGTEDFDVLLIDMDAKPPGLDALRGVAAALPDAMRPTVIALSAEAPAGGARAEAAGVVGVVSTTATPGEVAREIRRLMRPAPPDDAPAFDTPDVRTSPVDRSIYAALAQALGAAALGDFLATVEEDVAESDRALRTAAAANDMAGVRAATHVLIAVAGAVGALALQGLAERLNRAARSGDGPEVARLAADADAEARRLRAFLGRETGRAGR